MQKCHFTAICCMVLIDFVVVVVIGVVLACPGGRFGVGCADECACGTGNTCDSVNGTCICNSCYSGDYCEIGM